MHSLLSRTFPCTLLVMLAGCSSLVTPPEPMAVHDLGINTAAPAARAEAPASVTVTAPPWLHSSAMQYRLGWDQPSRRRAYTRSRWAAQPDEMLSLSLARGLGAGESTGSGCRLRIELDEFVQTFETPERSRAAIVLRASWLPARGETPLASQRFSVDSDTPSPDAEGGVAAYRAAAQTLNSQIGNWISTLPVTTPGNKSCGKTG